jgi:hypothetical protein
MKLLTSYRLELIVVLLTLQIALAQVPNRGPDYDAVKDFSTQSNPNGVWSYGYLTAWGAPFTLFGWGGMCDISGISWWFISNCDGLTSIAHNDTSQTVCWATVCESPNWLLLNPINGQLSVLRWTGSSSGRFLFHIEFVGLDRGYPTTTNVYVLRNSRRLLLKAPITSYQWPLLFEPDAWTLSAGDTIDVIVDRGKDKDFRGDSTGVEVKVWNQGQQ